MKTLMVVLLALFAFPALAEYDGNGPDCCPKCHLRLETCASIQKLYDAWVAKHDQESYIEAKCFGRDHRVGGTANGPFRTDPNYKAWKALFRQYILHDQFTRVGVCDNREFPAEVKALQDVTLRPNPTGYVSTWAGWHVFEYYGDVSSLKDGPPYAAACSDNVDANGYSVDKYGKLDPSGGGNKSALKYLVAPMILAVLVCLYFQSNGSRCGPLMGGLTIVGYAWATDPYAVAGHFLGVYMIVGYFVIAAFAGGVKLVMAVAKK